MDKKNASIMLICLMTLSIVYACSTTALATPATQSTDVAHFKPTSTTEDHSQNAKLLYAKPNLGILGDPIDDPRPHRI